MCCCITLQSVLIEQTALLRNATEGPGRSQRPSVNPEDYLQYIYEKKNQISVSGWFESLWIVVALRRLLWFQWFSVWCWINRASDSESTIFSSVFCYFFYVTLIFFLVWCFTGFHFFFQFINIYVLYIIIINNVYLTLNTIAMHLINAKIKPNTNEKYHNWIAT